MKTIGVASVGMIVGLAVWWLLLRWGIGWLGGSDLALADQLGVVSYTVLQGYSKQQELWAWGLGCVIVPGFVVVATWLGRIRIANHESRITNHESQATNHESQATNHELPITTTSHESQIEHEQTSPDLGQFTYPRWLLAGVVTATGIYLISMGFLWGPNPWGTFGLLAEEGVYLGASQALSTGRALYSDLDFPYGPLLILPLHLWLSLVGESVVAARIWVLFLHLLGLLAVAATLRGYLGGRRGQRAGLAAALLLALLAPLLLPNLNSVLLRPVMAFLPAALLMDARRRQSRRLTTFAGASLTVAILISIEVGAAALAGSLLALTLLRPPMRGLSPVRELLVWVCGAAACAVLALSPLIAMGSLDDFMRQTISGIQLSAAGYQALPYPDLLAIFADADGQRGSYSAENFATVVWAALPPLLVWLGLSVGLVGVLTTVLSKGKIVVGQRAYALQPIRSPVVGRIYSEYIRSSLLVCQAPLHPIPRKRLLLLN